MLITYNRYRVLPALGCFIFIAALVSVAARPRATAADDLQEPLSAEAQPSSLAERLGQWSISYSGFAEGQGDFFLTDAQGKAQDVHFDKHEIDGSGRLRLKFAYDPAEQQSFVLSFDSKYWSETVTNEIYEAYWHRTFEKMDMRLGKQIVTWGRCDEIIPLDVINPQDLRRFFLPLREERKLPVWMAHLNYYLDSITLSALWVPFFESSKLADGDQRWDVRPSVPETIDIYSFKIPIGGVDISYEEPDDDSLKNGQYGFKLTKQTDKSIFDLVYYYGWDPIGVLAKNVSLSGLRLILNVHKKHFRDRMAGASFSTLLGDFVLRGEAAYHWDKYFDIDNIWDADALAAKNYLSSCLGIEYMRGEELYMNFLVQNNAIMDHDSTVVQRQSETILFGIIDKFWDRKTFRLRLLYYYNIDDGDGRFNPEISYELADGFRAALGSEIIGGDRDTDWGQFDNNDLIYMELKYSF